MIVITGSKGFIGQNFLKYLLEYSNEEIVTVGEKDAWDWIGLFKEWDKVSLILHQGAISDTTETNIDKLHAMNVWFSIELFEKAIQYQIPVKFASSASVYGNQEGIVNPLNYYAITKLQMDYYIHDHMEEFSSIQSFRYFNVYGDGEDHKGDQASPVHKFTKQIKETGKLKLFEGSDKFLRDFIWVGDIVETVLNNNKPSGIYDLGTSNPTSFQTVGELIAEKYNGEIEYIPFPDHLRGKYQTYTCAKKEWDHKFISVKEYLRLSPCESLHQSVV
jgi:ADP-L-glycero-D-manno-heptose 6-epimerase|tara:strand:+ start:200 stop:1024 length:825 start_codon:yes stop_codon:yes gene_type:complete